MTHLFSTRKLAILALVLAALAPRLGVAQEGPELRAARVCAGLRDQNITGNGTFEVDGVTIKGNSNGTYTLSQNGVDMANIEKPKTYEEYVTCLMTIMKIITPNEKPSAPGGVTISSPTINYGSLLAVWSGLRLPNPCRRGRLAPPGMFLGSAEKGRFFVPA